MTEQQLQKHAKAVVSQSVISELANKATAPAKLTAKDAMAKLKAIWPNVKPVLSLFRPLTFGNVRKAFDIFIAVIDGLVTPVTTNE